MPTSVMFGDTAATSVEFVSTDEVVATLPAGAVGPVDVAVTTSGGTATAAAGFEYTDQPMLDVTVPATIPVTVGTQSAYETRLTNFGAEAPDVTEEIRLSNAAGDLTAADVVYETQDVGGQWNTVTWTEDAGDLVVTYEYTRTRAGLDQTSNVRVTVARDTGDISGSTTFTNASGQLEATTYTYTVTAGA